MGKSKKIYCCECSEKVLARLTTGKEVYTHRRDLFNLPFWKCDECKNFVGCHHKNKHNPTQPLGNIAGKNLKKARQRIHALIDPVWESGKIKRGVLYKKISDAVGWKYHTSEIKTIEEARNVYRAAREIIAGL